MSVILETEALLAIDLGSVNTRASLFDVVEGRYRLVATGRSPSTVGPPLFDAREGVGSAIEQVHAVTGRRLIDVGGALIMPCTGDGSGVDLFVATSSAGPRVRAVLVGLMPGVSLESARRLARSAYVDVVEEISILDRLREEQQISRVLLAKPDLVIIAGGTDGGASESVSRMAETVGLALRLFAPVERPRVLYVGNQALVSEVGDRLGDGTRLTISPNVRPSLDREELVPARLRLAEAISELRSAAILGFDELEQWAGGSLTLSADGMGRVVRYLSQVYDPEKGVLGVDLGASRTTVAAAIAGDLRLAVEPDLGMGASLPGLFDHAGVRDVRRWLSIEMTEDAIRDYVYDKSLHPGTVPVQLEELHLEYALARLVLSASVARARRAWPRWDRGRGLLPQFEPIVASGGVLALNPNPSYAALVLLDALQPVGITTLVLDPYNLMSVVGAAGAQVPMLAVQVLGSGCFVSLGTVVSPMGKGRAGTAAVRAQLEREERKDRGEVEVSLGQLSVLPLRPGEHGRLTLWPAHGFDVGFGPGKSGALRVAGGAVGVIIDARGRPLQLLRNPVKNQELNRKWLRDIGATK